MNNAELVRILESFKERCAVECDKEKRAAEERMPEVGPGDMARFEYRGQQKAAYWCAKHVREVDVSEWVRQREEEIVRARDAARKAEADRRAALPLAPCGGGGYGCGNLTPGGFACEDCKAEYRADPDAFK